MVKKLGSYKIEEHLGAGAYADVYRAVDTRLDRVVALKVLKPEMTGDENALARFLQEAKTLANLIHPRIAWVWDVGQADGRYFLAMRYVDGPSLEKALAERGPLPWEEALRIVGQIAEALGFAHEEGLVHRDVKPGNIQLSEAEGAVLTDFGLVKALDTSGLSMTLTATQGLIGLGTPHYMAPEQWENEGVGPAADQYALACVLCEMVSGEKLFPGDTPVALMKHHVLDAPVLPAGLPSQASRALAQALKKDPAARFETLKAFVDSLAVGSQKLTANGQQLLAVSGQPSALSKVEGSVVSEQATELVLELAPGVMMTFVRVPAGVFLMGSDKKKDSDAYSDELPQHEVHLEEYWMGKYPVTNAQYKAFVDATGHRAPMYWGKGKAFPGKENHPVVRVNWHDALAFCHWASEVTGERIALPSEAEWEKAARGGLQIPDPQSPNYPITQPSDSLIPNPLPARLYPWGDQSPTDNLCNFAMNIGHTTPVGRYSPQGDSPYGCADMAGNVWEWTRSLWGKDWWTPDFKYPYTPTDGREELRGRGLRMLRGASFRLDRRGMRCAFRYWSAYLPNIRFDYFSFRALYFPRGGRSTALHPTHDESGNRELGE